MKKLFLILAVLAVAGFAAPQSAKAGVHVAIGLPGVYIGPGYYNNGCYPYAYGPSPYYGYYGHPYYGGYRGYYGHGYYGHGYYHHHR